MNLSLQIGRGLAALALCAALGGYAALHPALAATPAAPSPPTVAAVTVTAIAFRADALRDGHKKPGVNASVVVGMPITLGVRAKS